MTKLKFTKAKISGVCTVIPDKKVFLDDESYFYSDISKLQRMKSVVGLSERTVANAQTTPSDLMLYAANKILKGMNINPDSIDALICVQDNPDYKIPPNSCILHGKLKLPLSCMAFDINHGCTGYIYGLCIAFSMIESGCKKILLLVGDTKSHTINIKDRICAPIFGDGAAATLVESSETENSSYFVIGTEGCKFENIMIPAGGARMPSDSSTQIETSDEYGNIRSLNNFRMNGKNVFDFTITRVPENIMEVLEFANVENEKIDYFVLHQANKSIIYNIASRLGIENKEKFPIKTLEKYGNLAIASIPSVLNDQLTSSLTKSENILLLSGFGTGLSFGSAIVKTNCIYAPNTVIYKGEDNE